MKKLLSVLLALVMLTSSMLNILVFAVDTSIASKIAVENTYSFPGGTVDVEVKLSNNPGIYNLLMSFEYDSAALKLITVSNGDAMSDVASFTPPKNMASGCNASWYYIDEPDTYKDGSLVVLTFEVLETAEAGKSYSVSVTNVTAEDVDGTECGISLENGKVRIIDYIPGDVNGDGRHTIRKDVSELNQYIVDGCKYDPLGYGIQLNEDAADVNDDDKINIRDVIQINKYIVDGCTYDPNGYAVKLLPHTPRCQHTSLTVVPAKEASCTEDGNIAYWYCECGKYFGDAGATNEIELEATIVKAAHAPGDEATCTQAQTCTKCDGILKAANGHTEVAVPGYAATTEKEGLTDGTKCSICDEWIIKQNTIPVLLPEKYTLTYYNNGNHNTEEYIKNEILVLSAPESVAGYDFNGWFTKPDGDGEKIELILAGNPDNIQVVYADYTPIEYQITFTNANGYKEKGIEYTIESKDIYLTTTPEWQHLVFMGWNDASGKLQYVNDTPVIKSGTTGDIVLDATWKTKQNMLELPEKEYSNAAFNPDDGMYYFFYHLGNVKNVLLQPKEGTGREHSGNTTTLTTSKTVTVSNSTAKEEAVAVSNALRASFENTFESSVTTELSTTIGVSATAGAEVNYGFAKANASATASTEITAGAAWSATVGGSYSEEGETSHSKEFSSTVCYMEESSITQETSITLDSDDPKGWYYFVPAGTFEIYSVVLYDPISKELKFDVFSKHVDTYPFTLYVPYLAEVKVNPEIDSIDYDYFAYSIKEKVNNSLFVFYESGHEDVMIDEKNNIISGNYNISSEDKLPSCNWYSRDGYVFNGWRVCDNDGNVLLEKIEDGAAISELAECCSKENKVFKLSAIWAKKVVVELDQTNVENAKETTPVIYVVPDREKIYKDIECTEEITIDDLVVPERTGYAFCGYYKENVEYISNEKIDSAIYMLTSGDKLLIKWNPNTYTVMYDANGGDGEMDTCVHAYDIPKALNLNQFTKEGYGFIGWNTVDDGSGTNYNDGEVVSNLAIQNEEQVVLYAQWKANEYYVVFDGNGATGGDMLKQKHIFDSELALRENEYVKSHTVTYDYNGSGETEKTETIEFNFAGWMLSANGNVIFADCETVKNLVSEGETTLYANWGTDMTVFCPNPQREGYVFDGWYKEPACTNKACDGGESYAISEDTILYAKWTANTYTVMYDANGGTGTTASSTHTYDEEKRLTPNGFSKTGCYFNGWNTNADGSGESFSDMKAVKNLTSENGGIVTLYAEWTQDEFTVWFDANGGSVTTASKVVTFDSPYGDLPIPTRTGYTFDYWSYNGQEVSASSIVNVDSSHTLVAKWTLMSYVASWNTPANVTIVVKRTSSPNANATTGKLSSEATVYYGDVLSVTYSANAGYTLLNNGVTSVTVTGDITFEHIYANVTATSSIQYPR